MKKVSVIVPVFNSSKYLSICVDSLLNQSYSNIEVLLIDDGSTDGSGAICDSFSHKDSRVIVIHKENGGICSARNCGLDNATGDYVMFCDDDDVYEHNAINEAVNSIEEYDLVKFVVNYYTVNDGNVVRKDIYGLVNEFVVNDINLISLSDYIKIRESKSLVYIWNAIYKSAIIYNNNIRFDSNYKFGGEDFDFNIQYLMCCKSVLFSGFVAYSHYRRIGFSTSTKYNDNQIQSVYFNLDRELSLISGFDINNVNLYVIARQFVGLMSIFENKACKYGVIRIRNEYREYYSFIKQKNNKFNYRYRDLKECHFSNKRIIILYLLKLRLFCVLSIISYLYRSIK